MYRSINQLSQARAMKKNAILAFALFLIILTLLVVSTKNTTDNSDIAQEQQEVIIRLP